MTNKLLTEKPRGHIWLYHTWLYTDRWGLAIGLILAFCISIIDRQVAFVEYFIPFLKRIICSKYFYEVVGCPTDDYSVFIINFLSVSITVLTLIFFFLLVISCYYFIRSIFSVTRYIPSLTPTYKYHFGQLFIPFFILYILWGKYGLTYYDTIIIVISNTFGIWLIYKLLLCWILSLFNLFINR